MHFVSPWNKNSRAALHGRKNILDEIKKSIPQNESLIIWMHCFSTGEFEQALPLIKKIKENFPAFKIGITFFSSAGYEANINNKIPDYIFYLPFDSKQNARAFINLINPTLVFWMKDNLSFFYLQELKKRNINTLLINAVFNEHQSFLKWYGNINRLMLQCFTNIFVQTEKSKILLNSIHISENVIVSGDTRFDRVIEIANHFSSDLLIEEFCDINNPVIVAGSTWEEDEEELDHYANTHPEIKFIIAPHNIDEENLLNVKKLFRNSICYSELAKSKKQIPISNIPTQNVLIIDNIGMLSKLYKYATITYVGGGFINEGVHNVLEAAVYAKPVVFGPVIDDYIEALELVDCGGGIVIDSALEAEATFNRLLINKTEYAACCEASKNYVYSKKGATEIIIKYIQEKRLLTS